jgi:phospholipid/cholesterol/gamma-HCH transport system permease protein
LVGRKLVIRNLAISTFRALVELGNWVRLLIATGSEIKDHILAGRPPIGWTGLMIQADRVGWGSVPLVSLVSFFLGLTMALLTGYELEKFGTERLVPGLVAVSFSRELAPLLTGIMVAARIGAAFTAELGTMSVSEEIEAIEAMGIGPLRLLVAPRLLSVALLMPCLSVVSNLSALAGGFLVSRNTLHISFQYYAQSVQENLLVRDIYSGTVKSICFGMIIGIISCYKGLAVSGGAAGVGTSTTSSVVVAIATVIGFDSLFNICLTSFIES